jgi:putative transposase
VFISKAYKYRIYPNKTQQRALTQTFGNVRFVWNKWVEAFNDKTKQQPTLMALKKEFPFLADCSAAALQQKDRDFQEFKRQFFGKTRKKKVGRPCFKSRRGRQSYKLPNQKFSVNHDTGKIRLEKIGWVKFDNHRTIPADAKLLSITVSQSPAGDYYAAICFEVDIPIADKSHLPNVGIDLGIKTLAYLSDGTHFGNPKLFRENQAELARAQRHLSRKKKGSARYDKQKRKVAKLHERVAATRAWHLHNISRWIVDSHNEIGMEDLRVANMMKNRKLAKATADSSMAMLKQFIGYKQGWYGKTVKLLGTFEPSSKVCHCCGWKHTALTLADREFVCQACGNITDRDLNAAKNILQQTVGVNTVQQSWSGCKTKLHSNVVVGGLLRSDEFERNTIP